MKIVEINIKDLKEYENNPRNNDEAVEPVMNSIKEFGFKVPIIIDKDNVVIAGHTRLKAAKKLKLKTVPCIIADDLNEEQIKAFRLADNKVSEFATWDIELLSEEINNIFNINMSGFGFDMFEPIEEETERKDLSDKVQEKYEIVIKCKNEMELETTYYKLVDEGYDCQISTL